MSPSTLPGGAAAAARSSTVPGGAATATRSSTVPGDAATATRSSTVPGDAAAATRSSTLLGGAAALAGGVLVAWQPLAVVVVALCCLFVWGLTPARLTGTLFVVLFLAPVTADPGFPVQPVWVVLFVAAAVAVIGRLRSWDVDAPLASPALLAFTLPVCLLVTAAFSWPGVSATVSGILPFVVYALVAWHVGLSPSGMPRVAQTLAWVGVFVAVLAIYQRLSGTWPVLDQLAMSEAYTSTVGVGRSAGTMGHPIVYGTFCMAMMCVAVGMRFRWWQAPFAFNAVGLLLSGSRSAWIGAVCALVLWYLVQPRKVTRRGVLTVGVLAVVGGGLVVAGPAPVREAAGLVRERLANVTGQSSATARYERIDEAWAGIAESPRTVLAGRGPEAHVRFFEEIGIDDGLAQAFDNTYLTMWFDHGLPGLLVLVGLLVALFVRARPLTARLLMLGFAVQVWFFDALLWPGAVAVPLLALGLARAGSAPPAGPAGSAATTAATPTGAAPSAATTAATPAGAAPSAATTAAAPAASPEPPATTTATHAGPAPSAAATTATRAATPSADPAAGPAPSAATTTAAPSAARPAGPAPPAESLPPAGSLPPADSAPPVAPSPAAPSPAAPSPAAPSPAAPSPAAPSLGAFRVEAGP